MNYDVDTKRFNKLQKFKNSLAESIEFRDLEKAINKMIFLGDDHKDNQNYLEINTRIELLGKKPSTNLISKWLKPKGLNKDLQELNETEFKRLLKKQEILQKKRLIDMKEYFKPFELTRPGAMRDLENDIHRELFETDLQRSSTYLDLIEELEAENSRLNSSYGKSCSETTPTGIKHAEVILPRGSNYRTSPQSSTLRSSYRVKNEPSNNEILDVGNAVNAKIAEIENLVLSVYMNHEGRSNIMKTINTLKSQITTEFYSKKSVTRTPEKYFDASPIEYNSGHLSSKSGMDTGVRKPLLKIHQNHQNSTVNYLQSSVIQQRPRHFKSVIGSGKKEIQQFDLSFLANHNFSTDMISAFQ